MSRLLVFLHLAVKQRALQGELQAALTGVTVTAVGRVADFDRAIGQGQDALLSSSLVLQTRKLKLQLRGYRAGASDELYALLGADKPPDPANLKAVGTVDLLGREGTASFVKEMLGSTPKVERVTKLEDLLPLLQMQLVEAVLLPARLVAPLKQTSAMKLVERSLSKRVGLPAVTSLSAAGSSAVSAVAKLPKSVSERLGVDEWR
jgi:hypothetical protein